MNIIVIDAQSSGDIYPEDGEEGVLDIVTDFPHLAEQIAEADVVLGRFSPDGIRVIKPEGATVIEISRAWGEKKELRVRDGDSWREGRHPDGRMKLHGET